MVRLGLVTLCVVTPLLMAGCTYEFNRRPPAPTPGDETTLPVRAFVLGQPNETTATNIAMGLNRPEGVFSDGTRLMVADTFNHRVLIWNTIPVSNTAPDIVIGQSDFTRGEANYGGLSARSLNSPTAVYFDGTRLYVSDTMNHRVLIWNSFPATNYVPADLVLGQPNLQSAVLNHGNGSPSAIGLNSPRGIWVYDNHLFIADKGNNRVLVWNSLPTQNQTPATFALGQMNLNSNSAGTSDASLSSPTGICVDNSKIFVSDLSNHRVLIWSSTDVFDPLRAGQSIPANQVLGQPDFISNQANRGGALSAQSLSSPTGVFCDSTRIVVSDQNNHRILIFSRPITPGTLPVVLGQPDATTLTDLKGSISGAILWIPNSAFIADNKLLVADNGHFRVLVWNPVPTVTQTPANFAIGQPDLISDSPNNVAYEPRRFNRPFRAFAKATDLLVVDTLNNRVLMWREPSPTKLEPDIVLGQEHLRTVGPNSGGLSHRTLKGPTDATTDGTKLAITDRGNHRVLLWNAIPQSNGASADITLGQVSSTERLVNAFGVSARSLSSPTSAFIGDNRLLIADRGNHRVLIWKTIPTSAAEPPDLVLGQADFFTNLVNSGGVSSRSLNSPTHAIYDGQRLIVCDNGNRRVLIWNTFPSVNFALADLVLGQSSFLSNTTQTLSLKSMDAPFSANIIGNRFFVSDVNNNRILVWNELPKINGQAADFVFGQPNGTSKTVNYGGLSFASLYFPYSIAHGRYFFIVDSGNHRVLALPQISPQDFKLGEPPE